MNIKEFFDLNDKEYLNFKDVNIKLSNRPDICAFIILDSHFPGDEDIVSSSEHDYVYLSITNEQILSLSKETLIDLYRCGVLYHEEYECLYMFT